MNEQKGMREMNEQELEQAAGGLRNYYPTYRCPNCGSTKKVKLDWEFGMQAPYCTKCAVPMNRIV